MCSEESFNTLINNKKSRRISRRTVLAAGAAVTFAPQLARAMGIASAIRLHDHGTHTRLVLELSESLDFSAFRLANPYRVVVDLPELDWTVAPDTTANPVGVVKAVHFGLFQGGNGRMVIDLNGPAVVKSAFVIPPSADQSVRLVMDFETTTRPNFMASLGPQHRIGTGRFATASTQIQPVSQPVAPVPKNKIVVMIDPGHGGVDPGTIGRSGIYEKIITLAAAQQLKAKFEATGRYKAVLTRDRDVSLGLAERRELAHNVQADLFISLHADAIADKTIRGLSVYTLSDNASDKEAADLAEQENSADRIIGIDLSRESQEVRHILVDLAQRESMNLATKLAGKLIGELQRETTLLRHVHRFARFAVLKSPDIPSILIEMGYLSNKEDEAALKLEPYRAKLMSAVLRGVETHLGTARTALR